jgi:hypothetical protein
VVWRSEIRRSSSFSAVRPAILPSFPQPRDRISETSTRWGECKLWLIFRELTMVGRL